MRKPIRLIFSADLFIPPGSLAPISQCLVKFRFAPIAITNPILLYVLMDKSLPITFYQGYLFTEIYKRLYRLINQKALEITDGCASHYQI